MKGNLATTELHSRAADALKVALAQVSAIRVKEMRRDARDGAKAIEILAATDVLGHPHLLACGVQTSGEPGELRRALRQLRDDAASLGSSAIPVMIAPSLSSEAQQLCRENNAGYLDLEGNARLNVGEIFIRMRSIPGQAAHAAPVQHPRPERSASHRPTSRSFPTASIAVPLIA